MDNELEVIRDDMEETRANLANKLEALETQVRETVSSASETVTSTVEGVKQVVESVSDTVGSVTDTFNVSKHIEENPWVALGIAVAAGFAAGQMLGGGSGHPAPPQPAPQPQPPKPQPVADQAQAKEPSQGGVLPSLDSLLPDMNGALESAIAGVSGLAIGTFMGVIREVVANGLPPEWKSELTSMVDQITTQLGGKPLKAQDGKAEERKGEEQKNDAKPLPRHDENPKEPENKFDRPKRNNRDPVTTYA